MKIEQDINKIIEYLGEYNLDEIFKVDSLKQMELRHYDKGELIVRTDAELSYMYFLVEGDMKVFSIHKNGKSNLIRICKPLSLIGDIEVMTGYKVQCHVQAVTDAKMIALDISKVRENYSSNVKFLQMLIDNLSYKLYSLTNTSSINLVYSLEKRFAIYLLSLTTKKPSSQDNITIEAPKLTEIALFLGTSYRHLNRIVNDFIATGIIDKDKSYMVIKDLDKLRMLAEDNTYEF